MPARKRYKYEQVYSGNWVQPIRRGYRMKCCGCGLVHVVDFRLVPHPRGKKIQFRAYRRQRPRK